MLQQGKHQTPDRIGCVSTLVLLVAVAAAASRRRHQQPLFGLLVFHNY